MMFLALKEKQAASHRNISSKERKISENTNTLFGGGVVNFSRIFAFRGEFWNQPPEPHFLKSDG